MAKNRFKIESVDSKGKEKVVFFILPNTQITKEGQLAYNKAFREALQSGAILRQKLSQVMTDQGLWTEEKEAEYVLVLEEISEKEKTLQKGGISLSEARDVAIKMRQKRAEFRALIAERSSMDNNTAEGQADNERFSHLVYKCLLNEKGKQLFTSKEHYETFAAEPYITMAAGQLAEKLYGLDPDYESSLPENKFLTDYKLADESLRLVNNDGHLIDIDNDGNERLINEEGRFIAYDKDGEQYFVDIEGDKVSEEGDYEIEFSPFLDTSGKPIVLETKAEETEEEEEEEKEESVKKTTRTPRKKPTKRSQAKTQTE
jgi:hypothetical protein|tara:strand:+ start:325 stop:1272 length:948 start_codon:yes stop_codon:yes gene_type:complete